MPIRTPQETMEQFLAAFNSGNLEATLAFYESAAALLPQPGQQVSGSPGLRQALGAFLAMKPTLKSEKQTWVVAGDIALACMRWTLLGTGPDGKRVEMKGTSSDVFRRQQDGRWLVAIDNPWGTAIAG
jgi:uncharacterized protein (TIGR02246 family)